MLAFVDIQHEKITRDPQQGPPHIRELHERAANIGAAVGMPCQAVHYLDFSLDWLRANDVRAFFISGNTPDWVEYNWENFRPLQEAVTNVVVPVLGFCGGHQFIGITYGMECGPLGPLEPGEQDLMPEYHPGMRKEKGYLPLKIVAQDHPLFKGFPPGPVIMESHYWEIKDLSPDFELLASTDWCRIQVMRHRHLPIFSIQGHPEAYTSEYPDGKQFIRNFALATGVIRD